MRLILSLALLLIAGCAHDRGGDDECTPRPHRPCPIIDPYDPDPQP